MTDEQTPKKRRGRKPRISVTPRAAIASADIDAVAASINERRLRGEIIRPGEIPLREPGKWALRFANSESEPNRHYAMVHQRGWVPMTVDDLPDGTTLMSLGLRTAEDGRTLCKGKTGDEVLYKKPRAVHDAIKRREADDRRRKQSSEQASKHDAATAAAAQFGSEAADYIANNTTVQITDRQGPLG